MAAEEKKKRKFRFPILLKTAIIIFLFSFVIVEIAMTYYSLVMSNRNKETYNNYANSLSSTVAHVLDPNEVNTLKNKVNSILETIPEDERVTSEDTWERQEPYIAHFDPLYEDTVFMSAFENIRATLRDIVDSNSKFDVDCMYLSYVFRYTDASGNKQGLFVYLVDSAPDEDACPPGWLDPVYSMNKDVITNPDRGFPAYTTNTSYGYLVTSGSVIPDTDYAYACVDISMTAVRAKQASSIVRLFVYMIVTINLLGAIGILVVYFFFSRPLKRVTLASKSFNNNDPQISHEQFVNLKVRTRDELQDLAEAVKTMENGVLQRINELVELNNALLNQEKQTAKMTALANKDSLTGVQSKTAYDTQVELINEQIKNKEPLVFGLAMIDLNYLKLTNDEFGHVAGDDALIRLANVICLTFKHSPVYRVGGDEFVVILRGEDYNNSQELVNEFNERIMDSINNLKLPQYERISAAIGYTEYEPSIDTCIDDVFKRADKLMYDRKRHMKEDNE